MTRSRPRIPLRRRVWGGAVAALVVGAVVYVLMAYRVLQAGGFTTTSVRAACAEAATGEARATYRSAEIVDIEHTFLPLSATCRWAGGTSADLVAPSAAGWTGPVLFVAGIAVLVGLQLTERRGR